MLKNNAEPFPVTDEICVMKYIRRQQNSTHYLSDTNKFYVSSKGPSSGISRISGITLIPDQGPLLEMSNLFVSLTS